jgi:hypothetical protein
MHPSTFLPIRIFRYIFFSFEKGVGYFRQPPFAPLILNAKHNAVAISLHCGFLGFREGVTEGAWG